MTVNCWTERDKTPHFQSKREGDPPIVISIPLLIPPSLNDREQKGTTIDDGHDRNKRKLTIPTRRAGTLSCRSWLRSSVNFIILSRGDRIHPPEPGFLAYLMGQITASRPGKPSFRFTGGHIPAHTSRRKKRNRVQYVSTASSAKESILSLWSTTKGSRPRRIDHAWPCARKIPASWAYHSVRSCRGERREKSHHAGRRLHCPRRNDIVLNEGREPMYNI